MAAVVYSATGKRKTSVARVRLMPGTGNITVNGKDVKDYFNRQTLMLDGPFAPRRDRHRSAGTT